MNAGKANKISQKKWKENKIKLNKFNPVNVIFLCECNTGKELTVPC